MISSRISGGAGGASIRCTVVANSVSLPILEASSRLTLLFPDGLTQPDDFIDVLLAKRHANDDHVALRQISMLSPNVGGAFHTSS
jgi:hypothetical protein